MSIWSSVSVNCKEYKYIYNMNNYWMDIHEVGGYIQYMLVYMSIYSVQDLYLTVMDDGVNKLKTAWILNYKYVICR